MVNKSTRYLKIFFVLARINFLRAIEYRADFITGFIPSLFYSLGYVGFIGAIFGQTPMIAGWDFDKMLLLFAASQLIYYSAWLIYREALYDFIDSVRDGSFDFVVKLPINARFVVSTRTQVIHMSVPFIIAFATLVYAARNVIATPLGIVLFVFLLIVGAVIFYNIVFTLVTTAFWIIDSYDLFWFADDVTRFGSYPLKVYPPLFGLIFLTIIPVLLLIYVPVTALLNLLDIKLAAISILMVVISSLISEKIWQAGLRHYSSASS